MVILVGATAGESTLTVTLAQELLPQVPLSHLAKYVVVALGAPIVNEAPTPTSVPPHVPRYHRSTSPVPPLAASVIVDCVPWQ